MNLVNFYGRVVYDTARIRSGFKALSSQVPCFKQGTCELKKYLLKYCNLNIMILHKIISLLSECTTYIAFLMQSRTHVTDVSKPIRAKCVPHGRLGHAVRVFEQKENWLVALSRNGSEWREAQRVLTDGRGHNNCALSD